MDCRPPGFPVHGILRARVLEWVAISFSRGSSQPRDLHDPEIKLTSAALAGRFFTAELLVQFSHSVMSDSATPCSAARQASLSITNSGSLLRLMSIKSVMHPTLSSSVVPFSSCLQSPSELSGKSQISIVLIKYAAV